MSHPDYIPAQWLGERIVACQSGGRYARRIALQELADRLPAALLRIAIVQQRRSWLATHSLEAAEDAASHAYYVFLKCMHTLTEPEGVMAWFRVVIRNFLVTEAQKRSRILYTDDLTHLEGAQYDHTGVLSIAALIRAEVNELPHNQRVIIYLHYWKELQLKEIADLQDTTRQAVGQAKLRALKRLRKRLLERDFLHDGWADTQI